MKELIRQRARELGFDDCRFTTAKPADHAPAFRQWLAEQRHGEMGYLERTAPKRVDPQQVLAGARSIITLAVSYAQWGRAGFTSLRLAKGSRVEGREPAPNVQRSTPLSCEQAFNVQRSTSIEYPASSIQYPAFIARYARFTDYHDVMGERLTLLAGFVNGLGDVNSRSLWYVDTGPVLERDFAQRAGLGFIGKHTNLISRRFGNWLFLAEILTTLELEPDVPEKNRCGTCARCLAACPTGAIPAPFQLDARRCISYLTIELKGSIPVELRTAIGNRIFGCDDCLAVCPWNRFAQAGGLMKEHARPDLAAPALLELLTLDEAAFRERFAGTPILRAKRRGLLRNVCVALGNTGDATALPALQKAAADPEPLIAEHAQWAIGQIQARTGKAD
jgi:epoxyqueuosine reductase